MLAQRAARSGAAFPRRPIEGNGRGMSLRPHLTATFLLGLPLVGTHVSRMLIGVTDTVLIGRYGVD